MLYLYESLPSQWQSCVYLIVVSHWSSDRQRGLTPEMGWLRAIPIAPNVHGTAAPKLSAGRARSLMPDLGKPHNFHHPDSCYDCTEQEISQKSRINPSILNVAPQEFQKCLNSAFFFYFKNLITHTHIHTPKNRINHFFLHVIIFTMHNFFHSE